jgi:hypothetical protein
MRNEVNLLIRRMLAHKVPIRRGAKYVAYWGSEK